jgi:hypothetical protein
MSQSEDGYLDWERTSRIALPSKAVDEYMLVPVREFRRLHRRIDEELSPRHESIPGAYFALFGAAIATGVAIPPLLTASGLPSWIIPTFIVSAGAFLVLGLALVLVSRSLDSEQKKSASEIAQEMCNIEAIYSSRKPVSQASELRSMKDIPGAQMSARPVARAYAKLDVLYSISSTVGSSLDRVYSAAICVNLAI